MIEIACSNQLDISDIKSMADEKLQTKQCPLCGEIIQVAALKCRFCREFLNSENQNAEDSAKKDDETILFQGKPSLWAMAGVVIKGAFFVAGAVLLLKFPVENTLAGLIETEITESQLLLAGKLRIIISIGIMAMVFLVLLLKVIRLKMTHYEVTTARIEWNRGVLDRRVDNIDMFRVVDLKMRRSLLDCVLGIGTVGLITTDKTDPTFDFAKMTKPRKLYDVIKKASLDADRENRVVHME